LDGNVALGLLLAAAGCVGIYLASPNQRWRAAPWPATPARGAGAALLVAGLAALLQPLKAPAATFVFVHWLMLLFTLFPYLGALRHACRKEGP
jgi:FtsH-binding integral membrane protein